MIEAVFISDLHLHPKAIKITKRFDRFLQWAQLNTKNVYILGDLFHVWPGDDSMDEWSRSIADKLSLLGKRGVRIFFMAGNRDFLLGDNFARLAEMQMLKEPSQIELGGEKVLLVHGDRYCTKDWMHQCLRKLTRNKVFITIFLSLPLSFRSGIANRLRKYSQTNNRKSKDIMDVVIPVVLNHMKKQGIQRLIHGHTHRPSHTVYDFEGKVYERYVLSDWDDNPLLLCYDNTNRFYKKQLPLDLV